MPLEYRNTFDDAAVREHAAIVARRGDTLVHVEIWRHLLGGGAIACVLADDRPGLLSFVSASLAAANMNVLSVQAYTRTRSDGKMPEAVDFVWFRRQSDASAPIGPADVGRIVETLRRLMRGDLAPESLLPPRPAGAPASAGAMRVGFARGRDAGHSVLTVEASDEPGLLLAVTLALFRARVQIVASRADTKDGGVTDRFTIAECDGRQLSPARRAEAQAAVHAAVEGFAGLKAAPTTRPDAAERRRGR